MLIWSVLRVIKPEETKPQPDINLEMEMKIDVNLFFQLCNGDKIDLFQAVLSCPFIAEAQSTDFFAYKLPIIFLLAINSFFLVWIMVVSIRVGTMDSIIATSWGLSGQINLF